jgi:hypothetical protein
MWQPRHERLAMLGKYITKAVDDAISAAIGGKPGDGPGVYPQPNYSPQAKPVGL